MSEITVHEGAPFLEVGGPLRWREADEERQWRTCSHCGSMHPEDLVRLGEEGRLRRVDMADWKYGWPHKVYADIWNDDRTRLYCVGGMHQATEGPYAPGGEHYRPPDPGYVAVADLTPEQLAIAKRGGMLPDAHDAPGHENHLLRFGTRETLHGKFYNVHQVDCDDDLRENVAAITGYRITRADGGKIRWQRAEGTSA